MNDESTDLTLAAERALAGTPVYGLDDDRLGKISRDGMHDGRLLIPHVMLKDELSIAASTVVHRDATGVYTSLSWRDLEAMLPSSRPGSEQCMLDAFSGGAHAAHADRFPVDLP